MLRHHAFRPRHRLLAAALRGLDVVFGGDIPVEGAGMLYTLRHNDPTVFARVMMARSTP
jgi:hypothetical protein